MVRSRARPDRLEFFGGGWSGVESGLSWKPEWIPDLECGRAREACFAGICRLSMTVATSDGTAKQLDDYSSVIGSLTPEAGETAAMIEVPIVGDGKNARIGNGPSR